MIRIKHSLLLIFLMLGQYAGIAQTIKGYTKAELEEYATKVEDQVLFLEYLMNTIGSSETPARDKDVIIRESYLKIFRDAQVQVEDDLLLDRKVVTNKDVTAYLKDIEFFYKDVNFKFKVRDVKPGQKENGDVFFLVSLDRTITATGKDGKAVTNTKPRFVEVNLLEKSQELKIVSMYTTKLSRDEELLEWWEILNPHWKAYFQQRFDMNEGDSVGLDQLYKFVAVDSLDISGTDSLLDLSPMEALRELRYVNLSNTQITQLAPISNVTFLEYLDVSNTPTSDIQFIKYSERLKHLDISNTQIHEIGDLSNLKALVSLKAVSTPISSFSVLNDFDSLRALDLTSSGFNNLENIRELSLLENLNVSKNFMINFSSLGELKSLKALNLSETNVQDLSPLATLDKLEIIDLTATEVGDISVLNSKPYLSKVLADQTSLSPLAADNFIRNNPKVLLIHHVRDLESWWGSLSDSWKTVLRKANPKIQSDQPNVEVLTETIGLEELDLRASGIQSLNPATRFVKLRKIDFSENQVSDLLPLSEVKTLEEIVGESTQVGDISALKDNELLKSINLAGSPLQSILDILSLPELAYLNVDASPVFPEEIPDILIRKPELTLIYRTQELTDWWNSLSTDWKDLLKRQYSLQESPTSSQLHNLTAKSSLEFQRINVQDLSPLTMFVNLRSLDIFDATLHSVGPLAEMHLLTSLRLSQVPVVDFSPVGRLAQLEELDISNTGIEDLTSLSNLFNLKKLNISGTNLKTLRGLEGLLALEQLDVASTNLGSLKPIEGLPNLLQLACFNTRLSQRSVDHFKELKPECEVRFY
ncbi:leucine-rich repeat domain-containing protein [Algoriphagus sp. CAU 1675]|uniref:leucine-rich repeat domain-containing protein n=1 Tax=Algoriphagus sp. CAU 1675 TaxID=3032597 RepID=UPI0023D9C255|nr:leucine-rich repeat domain-containing protein [Algoriphagus sp. CAU 1675]MDF2159429.1 leucine-rich repeat domain-containing protein [Algoriphagus sp. CAU 1675]